MPCVREAAQKPPFRPLAPSATPVGLQDDDAQPRVRLEQADRRPQAGEPAADDRDVCRDPALERRSRRGSGIPRQVPERAACRRRRAVSLPGQSKRPRGPRGAGPSPAGQCTRIGGGPASSIVHRDSHVRCPRP